MCFTMIHITSGYFATWAVSRHQHLVILFCHSSSYMMLPGVAPWLTGCCLDVKTMGELIWGEGGLLLQLHFLFSHSVALSDFLSHLCFELRWSLTSFSTWLHFDVARDLSGSTSPCRHLKEQLWFSRLLIPQQKGIKHSVAFCLFFFYLSKTEAIEDCRVRLSFLAAILIPQVEATVYSESFKVQSELTELEWLSNLEGCKICSGYRTHNVSSI